VDPSGATVSPLDAGLRSGIGVFETLRAHGTAMLAPERHLDRLVASARRLDIPLDLARVSDALHTTLGASRDVREVAVRITVTAGDVSGDEWPATPAGRPRLLITLHPAPPLPRGPLRAVTVTARRWPADLKSTSYLSSVLAQRSAVARGGDVAVLTDGDELLETAEGNLVAVIDGALVTPPTDGRLLPGVTRGLVLEEGRRLGLEVRLEPVRAGDVARAEALLVTSAVSGIRTVTMLDEVPVPGSGARSGARSGAGSGAGSGDAGGEMGALHPLVPVLRDALESRRV
jgi:branched-subunit amino acid aminotransferase/4-amino-4-deoxychorismate lyase